MTKPDPLMSQLCRPNVLMITIDRRYLVLAAFMYRSGARWMFSATATADQVWHRDARRGRAARRHFTVSFARNLPGVQVVHGGVLPVLGHLVAGE